MTRRHPPSKLLAGLAGLLLTGFPGSGQAQGVRALSLACAGASQELLPRCQEAMLGVQAVQGGLGLAASSGNALPGSASTLGWRMKGSPRFSLGLRGSAVRAPLPRLRAGGASPAGESTATFGSAQAIFGAGIFDGFSIAPTMGGILSLDLTGSGYLMGSSGSGRLDPGRLGWGLGARLGLLRESFSAPGISVSAHYRSLGESTMGNLGLGDPTQGTFDLSVTSVRGVVGKDLMGLGLFIGGGWERYSGDLTVWVVDPGAGSPDWGEGPRVAGELNSERRLVFIGGTLTYLVLQLSFEGGWAEGFDPAQAEVGGSRFDPNQGAQFGSLSVRLTF